MEQDTRNIRDEFKGLTEEQIKAILKLRRMSLIFVCENIEGDFNFSSVVRTCNAFACGGVIFTGKRKWDRRGAVGVQNYETILYYETIDEAVDMLKFAGWMVIAAEQGSGSIPLPVFPWQPRSAIILGEEQRGISELAFSLVDARVEIPQFGSVPSLNVANAAGIMTYDYMLKQGRFT